MPKDNATPVSKRTVKLGASIEAVLPTAPYANQRPGFFMEITMDTELSDEQLIAYQKTLYEKCLGNLKAIEQDAIQERINIERKDLRFSKDPSGVLVPSVTSILNFDADFFMAPHLLREYAAQGTIVHAQVSHFLKTGNWITAKELTDINTDIWVDYVIIKKGELGLPLDGVDFPAFLKAYPISVTAYDQKVYNTVDKYCGSFDFMGMYDGKLTLCDVKRTVDKLKNFMQMAAYSKAVEETLKVKPEQMMIVPLQPEKTKQGFSKPEISTDIDKFYALFMDKRKKFKVRYGL